MFGLMSSEQLKNHRSLNSRRQIFYNFPNGAAPLTGLLSLMDTEETDKTEFGWFEKRMADQKTVTAAANAAGPFTTGGGDSDKTTAGWTATANDSIRIKTAANGTAQLKVNHLIWIRNIPGTASSIKQLYGVVSSIVSSTQFEMRVIQTETNILNTTACNGLTVLVIGSAYAEGARSGRGVWTPPKNPTNFTEIFRTAFTFTRSALKAGLKFDKTGIYKDRAKENSMNHMQELEKAFLFGQKSEYVAANDEGDDVPTRTTGGVLYFLQQWETGSPYGVEAASSFDHPNKRILYYGDEKPITKKLFNEAVARVFENTNNRNFEKLVLCGNGYLSVLNELFEGNTQLTASINSKDTYGMTVTKFESLFGTLYFKTHPLFNMLRDFNHSALIVDVGNLKYRPLTDSDTTLLKNRQENDADRRKDEWLTEAGLEVNNPDSHMFMDKVTRWEP